MAEGRVPEGLVDTHVHLNHPRLLKRLNDVLDRARRVGVQGFVVVGYDLASSRAAVELAEQHEGVWAAVGLHPHDAGDLDEATLDALRGLAESDAVVAIGETGLDFYRDLSPREVQVAAFERHLRLAEEMGLPVIVHCRGAQGPLLDVLAGRGGMGGGGAPGIVWHCFDGRWEDAERALELGAVLGFGGLVSYRRNEELRRVAARVPAGALLMETDAPYLAPEARRGRDNEPANLLLTAEALAGARGERLGDVVEATAENARRVFGLAM